ncbi:ornithine decarboxylase-like [Topomyia yanbarensis]|uniref:ornithine decarboxylase-like n=1 Tax=Topomyia yanbarensis TaxID=2498891 RepID=UPI00273C75DB|nr:ornithine decarboxylase-like [Topomyia yanbarensis]
MDILNILKHQLEVVDDSVSTKQLIDQLVSTGSPEQPVRLVELDNVVKRHCEWLHHLPRVHPFYNVQCNDDSRILGTAVLLDCGFVCASRAEIGKILSLGVDPNWIILSQPEISVELLKFARRKSVKLMVDSEDELHQIQQYYPEAEILIRFNFKSTQATDVDNYDPDRKCQRLLNLSRELALNVIGWCWSNIEPDCSNYSILYDVLRKGREIVDYAMILGFSFRLFSIGGGFAGGKDANVDQFAVHINQGLDEFFPERDGLTFIADTGKLYSAAAVTVVTAICDKQIFQNPKLPAQIERIFYYLNYRVRAGDSKEGVKPLVWKSLRNCRAMCKADVFGPVGDGFVCLERDMVLPELNVSDFLVFEDQGCSLRGVSVRLDEGSSPTSVVVIRRTMWEYLRLFANTSHPRQLIEGSKYLQKEWKIDKLIYE